MIFGVALFISSLLIVTFDKVVTITECVCKDARDDIYDRIFRSMTAEGVKAAFIDTWDSIYTMPNDNPRIVEGSRHS